MRFSHFSAALLSFVSLALASNVVDLDVASFDKLIGQDKPALVEFFAPWCGHCKNLAPVYEQLADAFSSDKVIIAKTDADGVGRELGTRFGVQGFPTLKWFPAGSLEPEDYQGGRDLDSLSNFITQQAGVKSNIKPPPPPAAVQLTSENFDDIALDDSKNVLVAFTAPWCGHCKNMKPAYEKVARAFLPESDCVVAQMDADAADNKPVATRYDVRSFPTIKFFPKGSKEPIPYNLGRNEDAFIGFLNEHCGTHRTTAGLLGENAGRVLTLDHLAQQFFKAGDDRSSVLSKTKAYLGTLGTTVDAKTNASADYYVKAMERVLAKGESWLVKEQARLAGLLGSPSLAPTKLDELKIKANILSAFASKKAEETYEAAEDFASGAAEVVKDKAGQVAEGVEAFAKMMEENVEHAGAKIKEEL